MEINSEAIKNEINSMDQVFLSVLRESIVHTKQKGRGSISTLLCQWPSVSLLANPYHIL